MERFWREGVDFKLANTNIYSLPSTQRFRTSRSNCSWRHWVHVLDSIDGKWNSCFGRYKRYRFIDKYYRCIDSKV